MSYTYRLYDSIDEAPREAWTALQRDDSDLYADPRFISAVEEAMRGAGRFWSLLIYDETGRPAGSASLCLYPLDAALLCKPRRRHRVQVIRRAWPRFMLFPILFCGLPVSAGQSHLRIAPDADAKEVLRQLDAAMTQLAAEARVAAIVCKEFADEDLEQTDYLCELGYVRGPSLPMNSFRHHAASFDEFCQSLRAHYRYKIRRSQRKFAGSGLQVAHFRGAEAASHYTDEAHELYLAVNERAEVKLEVLPAEFFRQFALRCGDAVRMTAIFQGPRIVALSWGLLLADSYQSLFIGLDYSLNNQYDLYFNLMSHDLDQALKRGAKHIDMGQTADVFKSRLGCAGQARHVYAKGTRWFSARPLRVFHGLLMPPPPPAPARDLFHESQGA